MATTQQQIAPLQDQIYSLDVQIKAKEQLIASGKGSRTTYVGGTYKWAYDKWFFSKAQEAAGGYRCASGYPFSSSSCGDVNYWAGLRATWGAKLNQSKAKVAEMDAAIASDEADLAPLKATKGNLQTQIDNILDTAQKAQDMTNQQQLTDATAAAMTDPVILGQIQEAEIAKAKAKEESKQKMIKYSLITLVVVILGIFAIRRLS